MKSISIIALLAFAAVALAAPVPDSPSGGSDISADFAIGGGPAWRRAPQDSDISADFVNGGPGWRRNEEIAADFVNGGPGWKRAEQAAVQPERDPPSLL